MSTELFYPPVYYVKELSLRSSKTIQELCQAAGIICKASGMWINRKIEVRYGKEIRLVAEPGDWGNVQIQVPVRLPEQQARAALAALAYGLHDLVAKQSIAGQSWSRVAPPRGRPKKGRVLSTKERQRRFREKRRGSSK